MALLGTGYIAEWHAKAIASIRDVELVAVCDQSQLRAEAFGRKFKVPRVYGTLGAMLAAEQLDAVHVLLPPEHHFQAAKTILNAGVNVFLEKPMCLSAQDGETLTRLAEAHHLRLGVGHNFLFPQCYERLRRDLHDGILGSIDHLTITWHRELPQLSSGPFDIWMLREPANIMLEVGSHSVAQVLDLLGSPEEIDAKASNPVELPSGQKFYRRWQVNAMKGRTAIELRFSFVPGFGEYTIQARGSLASATVDFDRDTYSLRRHRPLSDDFDRYAIVARQRKECPPSGATYANKLRSVEVSLSFKRHSLRGEHRQRLESLLRDFRRKAGRAHRASTRRGSDAHMSGNRQGCSAGPFADERHLHTERSR